MHLKVVKSRIGKNSFCLSTRNGAKIPEVMQIQLRDANIIKIARLSKRNIARPADIECMIIQTNKRWDGCF